MQSFDSLFLTNYPKPIATLVDEKKSLTPPPSQKRDKTKQKQKKRDKNNSNKIRKISG